MRLVLIVFFIALFASCSASEQQLEISLAPSLSETASSTAPILDGPDHFRFAVMGDRTGGHRPGVWQRSLVAINQLHPDFVMSVGDYIEGYSDDREKVSAEWAEFETQISELAMRFFYVAGNHDISNAVMTDIWETRRGPRYYHFRYKDVLFLVLNTEDPFVVLPREVQARSAAFKEAFEADPIGTQARVLEAVRNRPDAPKLPGSVAISDAQISHFKNALSENTDVRWTFVFMHKPAWRYKSPAFKELELLMSGRDYTVIAGHEHYYEHEKRNGQDYVTMATCGGVWLKDGPGRIDHTLWVTMTDNGPVFANIKIDGVSDLIGFEVNAKN